MAVGLTPSFTGRLEGTGPVDGEVGCEPPAGGILICGLIGLDVSEGFIGSAMRYRV